MFPRVFIVLLLGAVALRAAELKTRHVLFITTDGLRWQEVFHGAERAMMNKEDGGVPDAAALVERFWAETAGERRRKLMPFFWGTIAQQGQLFGNRDAGSLRSHNDKVPHAGEWWCAVLGPDTPPLGERRNCEPVTQAQIAATLARFLGENYQAVEPKAAGPILQVFPPP